MEILTAFLPEPPWGTVLAQVSSGRQKSCQELQMQKECVCSSSLFPHGPWIGSGRVGAIGVLLAKPSCGLNPPLQPWFDLPCPRLLAQGRVAVMPELSPSGLTTWQGADTHALTHTRAHTQSPRSCTFGHLPKCQHDTTAPFHPCPSVSAAQLPPAWGWQHSHAGIPCVPCSRAWTHGHIALGGGTAQHRLTQRVVLLEHQPPAPES